jgi:Ni/Co efflux regulator RcnB
MLRLITAVAVLSLAATTLATAADEHHGGKPAAAPAHAAPARPAAPARAMARPAPQHASPSHAPTHAAMARPQHPGVAGTGGRAAYAGRTGGPRAGLNWRGHAVTRVHAAAFAYPHGWHYRRWAVGATLPALFLTPAYYYTDWTALGLPPPDFGYEWVRFGPDLLLVNIQTGEVVDVLYGVFY